MTMVWRDVNFETPQSVFQEWMQQRIWVIDNNGEYTILIQIQMGIGSQSARMS
jgi:hypothetical protein